MVNYAHHLSRNAWRQVQLSSSQQLLPTSIRLFTRFVTAGRSELYDKQPRTRSNDRTTETQPRSLAREDSVKKRDSLTLTVIGFGKSPVFYCRSQIVQEFPLKQNKFAISPPPCPSSSNMLPLGCLSYLHRANSNLNYRLARDQVVHLETGANSQAV